MQQFNIGALLTEMIEHGMNSERQLRREEERFLNGLMKAQSLNFQFKANDGQIVIIDKSPKVFVKKGWWRL